MPITHSFAVISVKEFERFLGPHEIGLEVAIHQIWQESNIQYKLSPQFKSALMNLLLQGTSPWILHIEAVRSHMNQLSHVQKKAFLRILCKWLRDNGYHRAADELDEDPTFRWSIIPSVGCA